MKWLYEERILRKKIVREGEEKGKEKRRKSRSKEEKREKEENN